MEKDLEANFDCIFHSREDQDAFAVKSQLKAKEAIDKKLFDSEIVPIEVKTRKSVIQVTADEHPKPDTTIEGLAKLRTAFVKDQGTVTAGNASGINDGASVVMLMSANEAQQRNLKPMAKIVSHAVTGM